MCNIYVQYICAPNVKGFVCDMQKLLYWAGSLWCTEFTTLPDLHMHSSHFFDISQHSIAQSELLLWPEQQTDGVHKSLQDKDSVWKKKIRVFIAKLTCSVTTYSVRLVKRPKPRHLRKTRRGPSQQAEKSLLTKGYSSPARTQNSSLLSRCYQQMLITWPIPSDNQQRQRPL